MSMATDNQLIIILEVTCVVTASRATQCCDRSALTVRTVQMYFNSVLYLSV